MDNDYLEQAIVEALDALDKWRPFRMERASILCLIGLGYATAKGWAVYRGHGDFEITPLGVAEIKRRREE